MANDVDLVVNYTQDARVFVNLGEMAAAPMPASTIKSAQVNDNEEVERQTDQKPWSTQSGHKHQ